MIPVAIQKMGEQSDSSDLMQRWENGGDYVFLESSDEQEELASYLKDREAEGVKSVHFYFPSDLDASTQTTNHVVIDLSGFSSGVAAFKKQMRTVATADTHYSFVGRDFRGFCTLLSRCSAGFPSSASAR